MSVPVGGLEGAVLAIVGSVVVVALGTFLGVSLALQSFFGASSWDAVAEDGPQDDR